MSIEANVLQGMRSHSWRYLQSKGWRMIGNNGKKSIYTTFYWDHPDHQPTARGAFTTTGAIAHQGMVERNGGCDCTKGTR